MKTNRVNKLRSWMKEKDIPATIITSKESVFYFTGFFNDPHERLNALLITEDDACFVCPTMEIDDVKNAGFTGEIVGYLDTDDAMSILTNTFLTKAKVNERIALELSTLSAERYLHIEKALSPSEIHSAEAVINELRLTKDEEEIAYLREAAALADYAIAVGVEALSTDVTEMDILGLVEYELKKKGVQAMSFSTMVLTGKNAASPHGVPGNSFIQEGDFVLFDLGVVYKGYCSDITRTVPFGKWTDEQEAIYTTVLEAQEKAIALVKPGVSVRELDIVAREHIAAAGYGDYFPHRLGHGLGISVHEYPSITATSDVVLSEGMVFTIEPGIYVPNVAGVRIEDDVLVTANGCELLTNYPKTLA